MMSDHTHILTTAAKTTLAPLGCKQKGRSRTWLDDHIWWVGVIEFQPSGWSKGSYLNVGACWLWHEKNYFSFDDGYRVESFHEFINPDQFSDSASKLAEHAKNEVFRLRGRFLTIRDTAAYLCTKTTQGIWDNYHAGISAGLIGEQETARQRFVAEPRSKPQNH